MLLDILPGPESDVPEADRFGSAPHPREMLSMVGHKEQESEFLGACRSGRLHHAWLISGEEGIGKATLAYRMARFILAHGHDPAALARATDLFVPASDPNAHRISADAHPDLAVIRRSYNVKNKALFTEVRVDDVRAGLDVFGKTAGAGGYRVCIVDSCDEMNAHSANALLKTLEEPPAQSLFLLVTHQPRRLLPTIRSRCRALPLRPLTTEEVLRVIAGLPVFGDLAPETLHRAADLSEGSVRRALAVLDAKLLAFHDALDAILTGLPRLDPGKVDALAELVAGRTGDQMFAHFCAVCRTWLSRALRGRAPTTGDLLPVSEVWDRLETQEREVNILNLDRRPVVVSILSDLAALQASAR